MKSLNKDTPQVEVHLVKVYNEHGIIHLYFKSKDAAMNFVTKFNVKNQDEFALYDSMIHKPKGW